ncbi:MAG: ATP synthase F1 subunit delta [Ignavibacteriales bacterium]|nr:ATP synthase F1 subunit delta [Ignavibacteriales bacterium]
MSDYTISTRYARALVNESISKNNLDRIYSDINFIEATFYVSQEFKSIYLSPTIGKEKKIDIISKTLSKAVATEVLQFLVLLIKKNREKYILSILKRIKELRNEFLGYSGVSVRSQVPLLEKQKNEVSAIIQNFTKQKIQINYIEDKKILGGFVIQIGDKIIDGSVKNQLNKLKNKLTALN